MSAGPTVPSWPSLYDLSVEIERIAGRDPVQPGGKYLEHPHDVFRFTFYWMIVLYTPQFVICGAYAFFNIILAPAGLFNQISSSNTDEELELQLLNSVYSPSRVVTPATPEIAHASPRRRVPGSSHRSRHTTSSIATAIAPATPSVLSESFWRTAHTHVSPPRVNPRRTRLTYALIVLFVFLATALIGATVGAAITGYILVGLFKAGGFHMSTWIPFLFAALQALIGCLGVWPSIIEII